MLRYGLGPIAAVSPGKTKVVAMTKLQDQESGNVVYEAEVDGKVVMGLFGGSSEGATNGLAKEVAKKIRKRFF